MGSDDPSAAELTYETEHDVQQNDILVVASDGVFDNIFEHDILECVNRYYNPKTSKVDVEEAANCIGK